MNRHIERFADVATLQRAAAAFIVRSLNDAIAARGIATLVVSGGSTPKGVYSLLGEEPFCSQLSWNAVHLFWGDERCVPPDHPESNFRMVSETLLKAISIPHENIHRILAERLPHEASVLYEHEIQKFFGEANTSVPQFDVLLLGLGDDGHTASLFPDTTIVYEEERWVAEVFVPKFKVHRISMTYPVLINSRAILFLVSGGSKATIVREVLEGEALRYPAQRVQPTAGRLIWFLDVAAASQLSR